MPGRVTILPANTAGRLVEPLGRQKILVHGDLTVDRTGHRVRYAGRTVPLRPLEFRLLAHFLEHPDQVFSQAALLDRVWTNAADVDERAVNVCVGRLRKALAEAGAPDPLRTVRSVGYVLDSEPL